MDNECVRSGETLEEALDLAAQELGVSADELEYEVLSEDGAALYEVRAWIPAPADGVDAGDADVEGDGAEGADDPTDSPASDEDIEVSDEELDHIADTAIDFLREVLGYFGAQDAEIDEYEGDEGELILDIVGGGLGVLIGRYGKTLAALQQLTQAIVNKKLGYKYPIVVDVEGYRNRRRAKLESVARSAADKAVKRGGDVHLHPMTPYERRIVHIALRDNPAVETFSEGEGSERRVVVRPL